MYSAMLLESRLNYHKTLGWCHRNNRNTGHMEASGIPRKHESNTITLLVSQQYAHPLSLHFQTFTKKTHQPDAGALEWFVSMSTLVPDATSLGAERMVHKAGFSAYGHEQPTLGKDWRWCTGLLEWTGILMLLFRGTGSFVFSLALPSFLPFHCPVLVDHVWTRQQENILPNCSMFLTLPSSLGHKAHLINSLSSST